MNLDRKKYMATPDLHPHYKREWEKFYNYKCSHYGPMHVSYMHEEWEQVWKSYFFNLVDTDFKQQRNQLMNRHKVFYSDLDKFKKKQEMEARQREEDRLAAKAEIERQRFEDERKQASAVATTSSTSKNSPEEDKVTPLSTLRLLTAIESELGDHGRRVDTYLMKVAGTQDSEVLLEDAAFCELLRNCCEVLKFKMPSTNEQKKSVFKLCIDNIAHLLNQSLQMRNPEFDQAVRTNIAKKIIEEFGKQGRQIQGKELEDLVASVFENIKSKPNKPQDEQELDGVNTSFLDQIDWNEIQNVMNKSEQPVVKVEPVQGEFDDLTIEELAALFQNFKSIERRIQEQLIEYMKRLEKTNPAKVTELKHQIQSLKQ